ncbi:MAG: T9SS type A sorting domain-containing protein [Bacteroidia bacterium]|nr:T9SS type A sorting domain-containing protein [Bacteroidia bacterium]
MKKFNAFAALLLAVCAVQAQQDQARRVLDRGQIQVDAFVRPAPSDWLNEPASSGQNAPAYVPKSATEAINFIRIGTARNAYTYLAYDKGQLQTAPGIGTNGGTLTMFHRQNGDGSPTTLCPGGSGLYRYSISTDGGLTWNVGSGTASSGSNPDPAFNCYGLGPVNPTFGNTTPGRYPTSALFVTPNTTPSVANLRLAYGGPQIINGTDWYGSVNGVVSNLTGPAPIINQEINIGTTQANAQIFLPGVIVERVPGEFWYHSWTWNGTAYLGDVILYKGLYNASTQGIGWTVADTLEPNYYLGFDGSPTFTPANAMAFSPDGKVGYFASMGDLLGGRDSSFQIWYSETVDGGITWGAPTQLDMEGFPDLKDSLRVTLFLDSVNGVPDTVVFGNGIPTTAFDLDMTVDVNGNPHIIAVVGNASVWDFDEDAYSRPSYSIALDRYVVDFTKDQFGDWNVIFLDRNNFLRGNFGKVTADDASDFNVDCYVQASRSPDGDVVFLTWSDSDPNDSTVTTNNRPNLIGRALNVDSMKITPIVNFTSTDANWSSNVVQPKTAPVALYDGNCTYTLPVVTLDRQEVSVANVNGAIDPVTFFYFSNVTFDRCNDFTLAPEFDYNCQENPFTNAVQVTEPNCGTSDGAIALTAAGGIGPYTYQWSANAGSATTASVSGLAAGVYEVTITDSKGCTDEISVSLDNNAAPELAIGTVTDITCAGLANGSAQVTATGGTGTLTYLWSNGETTANASQLPAGTSTLTVTDASGCISQIAVQIEEPAAISASTSGSALDCAGDTDGSVSVTASGGTGSLTYAWNTGATSTSLSNLGAGTYTVTITDANNCAVTRTANVTSPAAINIGLTPTANFNAAPPFTGTATASVSGGTPPYTYAWTGPLGPIAAQPNATFIFGLCGGEYTVRVTDSRGCVNNDTAVVGVAVNGVNCIRTAIDPSDIGLASMEVFPNPSATGVFTLRLELNKASDLAVDVYDNRGRVVASDAALRTLTYEHTFDLSNQPGGIYLVKVTTPQGAYLTKVMAQP